MKKYYTRAVEFSQIDTTRNWSRETNITDKENSFSPFCGDSFSSVSDSPIMIADPALYNIETGILYRNYPD